jgi:cathepsin B
MTSKQAVIKSFGTVLADNSAVKGLRASLGLVARKDLPQLPEQFPGHIIWEHYLSPIQNQGTCGNCWAQSSVTSLSDRFSIMSLNQIRKVFSAYQTTVCESVISNRPLLDTEAMSQVNLLAHSSKACAGNTIQNACEHLYVFGTTAYNCFTEADLAKKGYKSDKIFENPQDIPHCEVVMGGEYDTCLNGETAARYFRASLYYAVQQDPDNIKYEIWKCGPIVSGFMLYTDFVDKYDGKSIYMGPEKDAKPIGGHAVKLVGWGAEDVDGQNVKYWIIANSWGVSWGLGGYFKLKIGIPECKFEENCFAMIPDIPSLVPSILDKTIVSDISRDLIEKRNWFSVDPYTCYRLSALRKILKGELRGELNMMFNTDLLPDYKDFIAAKVPKYPQIWPNYFGPVEITNNKLYSMAVTDIRTYNIKYLGKIITAIFIMTCVSAYIWYKTKNRVKRK